VLAPAVPASKFFLMGLVMDENKDAIIRQQWLIITDQQTTINQQRTELAYHRQFESRQEPWRFALWLLLHDLWPFSVWYHRHE